MTMVIFGSVIGGYVIGGTVGGTGLSFVGSTQQSSRLLLVQQSCFGQQVLQHALELELEHVSQFNDEHSHLLRQQD